MADSRQKTGPIVIPQIRNVAFPMFEIHSNPVVNLAQIKRRRMIDYVCPACGARVPDVLEHCREAGDPEHQVLEVMSS